MAGTKKEKIHWAIAKPILMKDYLDGIVTDSMKPKDVWMMKEVFREVKYENFRNNFARMKKTIREHKSRAVIDEAGFRHDMELYELAKDTEGCWDGSEAQQLLAIDMVRGRHTSMKPKLLWSQRPEYQQFSLEKFRGHIHQELRSQRETNYWIIKRQKKKHAERSRKEGKKFNEDDVDFYDPVLDM